jgi:hypothetical protein
MKRAIVFSALILIFLRLPGQLPSGYVAGWPFCGNASDISGNGHHGTVSGAVLTLDRFGQANSAYSFNGMSDFISMPTAIINGTVSRSISFWARSLGTSIAVGYGTGDASPSGGIFQVVFNYNCQGVGFDNSQAAIIRSGSTVNNGQWHHIVAVMNSSLSVQVNSVSIYVDAVLQSNTVCTISDVTSTVNSNGLFPAVIGKSSNSSQRFFYGDLDDFYLYNRALTPAEVTQLFNVSSGPAISVSGNMSICKGNSTTLTASGSSSYLWNGQTAGPSIVVSPTVTASYTVTGTQQGCSSAKTVTVQVSPCLGIASGHLQDLKLAPNPVIDHLFIGNVVPGTRVRIYDTGGRLILADFAENDSMIIDASGIAPGVYIVSINDPSGGACFRKLLKN